jgi:hypothetical protein
MLDRRNGQRTAKQRRPRRNSLVNAIESLEARFLMTRYAIISDMATTSATALPVIAPMVKGWNPEHIVTVGDNNNDDDTNFDATLGQYFHEYIDPYVGSHGAGSPTGNRLWPTIGNHDFDADDGLDDYMAYFTLPGNERYYTVRFDDVEFFMVNSDPRESDGTTPTSIQGQWLQGALGASTATWKVVLAHHPPYSSAGSPDAEWMRWPFPEWGADVVVSGHHHVYERLSVGGFPYVITSAIGSFLGEFPAGQTDPNSVVRYDSRPGAIQMDADAGSLVLRFFEREGTLIDTLTLTSATAPAAPTKLLAGAVSAGRVDLSWADNASDETGFVLERSPDGVNNWSQIATPAANSTNFSDTSSALLPGVTYHYRVRASGGVPSANSNTTSAATLQPNYFNYVARGQTWKYLDTGVSQGSGWRPILFDDSGWSNGRGQFGYGGGDETTVVSFGPDANLKYPTTYFRKSFTVDNPANVIQLDLSLLRDDGAVIYLNGTEVWRSNMPAGTITYTTPAASAIGAADENIWLGLSISPALLVAGNNVIAAEVHQHNGTSSDVSFDFVMTARMAAAIAPPSAFKAIAIAHNQVNLKWVDTTVGEEGFKIERSADGVSYSQIGTALPGATTYTDNTVLANKQYWYRARSYNASGDSRASSVSTVTTPVDPSTIMPAPWSKGDIGAVAAAGNATHNAGTFAVSGSGADIFGVADELHFVSQPWTGNGTIIARLQSVSNTSNTTPNAKAGVMFRESLAPGAREVSVCVTPAGQLIIMGRATTNGTSAGPPVVSGINAPVWLKLVRNGTLFTIQYSFNGTTWITPPNGSATFNNWTSTNSFVGMCVSSRNDGVLATGTFSDVSVTSATTLFVAEDTAMPEDSEVVGPRGKTKWKKQSASLIELAGLKKDQLDLLA